MAELQSTGFVGYVPVISDAYERLFSSMPESSSAYILGSDILSRFPHLRKDIRALSPERAAYHIETSGYFGKVAVLHAGCYDQVTEDDILVPEDELADHIISQLPDKTITKYPIFLRWDRKTSSTPTNVTPHSTVHVSELDGWVMPTLRGERQKATNWWRWVSAAVKLTNGQVVASHNHHLPTDFSPIIDGDIRMNFGRGADLGMTTDVHAEADLVARAAQSGTSLQGAELFVSTFTCPPCAKLVAIAGVRRCVFIEGYAMGDAMQVLDDAGVEVVQVLGDTFTDPPERLRPYKEKTN